jgi:flagellar hook-length control protein FliK
LSEQSLIEHGEKGIARDMQPKAGFELAQSLAELKTDNFPSPLNGEQNTSNLNAVLTDTSETTPATSQQINETLTLALGLDKPVIIAENISQQSAGEQLITQALNDNSETTTDQKGMVVAEPVVSTNQQIPAQLTNEELVLEPADTGDKTASNSEKPVIESASNTSGNLGTTVLQMPSVKVQIQSGNNTDTTNSSLTGNDLPLDVRQPTVNKSNTHQQTNPAQQNLLVSSDGNSDSDSPPQSDTTSSDILDQNLNPAQLHISANRTKNRAGSSPNDSNFQLLISHSNTQNTIADQTLVSATTVAKAQSSAYPTNLSPNLNEQIIQSIQSSLQQDQQQIIIRLNPPELGKVLIQFQQDQDQITGLLQVDKAETRAQIQQALPQIIQNLQDSGIQIKRLDVILQDQQQDYRDQTLQNGTFQQQQQAFSDTNSSDNNITNEWLINEPNYPGLTEPQDSFVTENSINILI